MKRSIVKLWISSLVFLATVGLATAGPIKGLVDIATGQEVPDADLRYVQVASQPIVFSEATNTYNWATGNVWYVSMAGDVQAGVNQASAGDTVKLGAGTFFGNLTITNSIALVGQGIEKTTIFGSITVVEDDVLIKDLEALGIQANGQLKATGTFVRDMFVENCLVTVNGSGVQAAIHYLDAYGWTRNCVLSATSSDNSAYGLVVEGAGSISTMDVRAYNVRATATGDTGQPSFGFLSFDNTGTQSPQLYLYSCNGSGLNDAGYGAGASGTLADLYAFDCDFNGVSFDVLENSADNVELTRCSLANDTESGIITHKGTIVAEKMRVSGTTASGTMVVNWQTMINYFDTVTSVTGTVAFAASSSQDLSIFGLAANNVDLIRGRLYIPNTDDAPFSAEATVTLYDNSARRGSQAIYRADMSLVSVTLSSPQTAGNNTIVVTDASDFGENDLIYLTGVTPEFARVASILGTTITLEDNLLNNHASGDGANRAPEFGGFSLLDTTDANTAWVRVDFGASQTVDLEMTLEHTP